MRILSADGGRSRETVDDYIEGPPELIAEVAHSTRSIDMHQKRRDYRRAGVRKYWCFACEQAEIHWFRFKPDGRIVADNHGVFRSRVFPGLWIDSAVVPRPRLCESSSDAK